MLWTVVAISGMLAVEPAEPPRAALAAVEVSFITHAGEGAAGGKRASGVETSVGVAWPGQTRGPLRPAGLADTVTDRFGAEMRGLSPACAIARAPAPESR
jgi:hypothetical protein